MSTVLATARAVYPTEMPSRTARNRSTRSFSWRPPVRRTRGRSSTSRPATARTPPTGAPRASARSDRAPHQIPRHSRDGRTQNGTVSATTVPSANRSGTTSPTWNPSTAGTANAAPLTASSGSPDGRYTTVGSDDVPCCACTAASDSPGTAEDRPPRTPPGSPPCPRCSPRPAAVWNVPTSRTANPTAASTGAAIDASRRAATAAAPRTSTPVAPRPAGTRRTSGTTRTGASSAAATSSTIADMRTIVGLSCAVAPGRSSARPPPAEDAERRRSPTGCGSSAARLHGRVAQRVQRRHPAGAARGQPHPGARRRPAPASTETRSAHQDTPTVNPAGSRPTATNGPASSGAARAPRTGAGHPGEQRDQDDLGEQQPPHLAGGGADGAQQAELAAAGRDGERAGRGHHEHRDEPADEDRGDDELRPDPPGPGVRSGSTADRASPVRTVPSGPASSCDKRAGAKRTPITRTPPANAEAVASSTKKPAPSDTPVTVQARGAGGGEHRQRAPTGTPAEDGTTTWPGTAGRVPVVDGVPPEPGRRPRRSTVDRVGGVTDRLPVDQPLHVERPDRDRGPHARRGRDPGPAAR